MPFLWVFDGREHVRRRIRAARGGEFGRFRGEEAWQPKAAVVSNPLSSLAPSSRGRRAKLGFGSGNDAVHQRIILQSFWVTKLRGQHARQRAALLRRRILSSADTRSRSALPPAPAAKRAWELHSGANLVSLPRGFMWLGLVVLTQSWQLLLFMAIHWSSSGPDDRELLRDHRVVGPEVWWWELWFGFALYVVIRCISRHRNG